MSNSICDQHLNQLCESLAEFYEGEDDIRRFVKSVGLNYSTIRIDGKLVNTWHSILSEAKKENRLKQLVKFVISTPYGKNPELRRIVTEVMKYCFPGEQLNGDLPYIRYDEVEVPIVIAAMTKHEIAQLPNSNVKDIGELRRLQEEWINPNLQSSLFTRSRFAALFDKLSAGVKSLVYMNTGIAKELKACYSEERDDWRPVYCNDSIKEIVAKSFDSLNNLDKDYSNAEFSKSSNRKFVPTFISKSFFSTDVELRPRAIAQLKMGGILIVDAFSLLHPDLREQIILAEVGGNKHTAILIVSPFNATDLPLNKQIVDL
ncbi:MAG: effector-associated domain EAD1-containing protein, partial [Caldilineaceae bacterium]